MKVEVVLCYLRHLHVAYPFTSVNQVASEVLLDRHGSVCFILLEGSRDQHRHSKPVIAPLNGSCCLVPNLLQLLVSTSYDMHPIEGLYFQSCLVLLPHNMLSMESY
jgi:hypothetical protein